MPDVLRNEGITHIVNLISHKKPVRTPLRDPVVGSKPFTPSLFSPYRMGPDTVAQARNVDVDMADLSQDNRNEPENLIVEDLDEEMTDTMIEQRIDWSKFMGGGGSFSHQSNSFSSIKYLYLSMRD